MGKPGEAEEKERKRKRKAPGAVATKAKEAPPSPPHIFAPGVNPTSQCRGLITWQSSESNARSDSASGSAEEDSDQSSELDSFRSSEKEEEEEEEEEEEDEEEEEEDEEEEDDSESPSLSSSVVESKDDRPLIFQRKRTVKKQLNGDGIQCTGTQESAVIDGNIEQMESTAPPGVDLQPCIQKKYLQPSANPGKHLQLASPLVVSVSKFPDAGRLEAYTPAIPARLHANVSAQPATSSLPVPPAPLVFDRLKPFLCEDTPEVSQVAANAVPSEPIAESSFPRFSHAKLMAMFWEVKDMLLSVKELEHTEAVRELDERINKLLFSIPGDVLTLKQRTALEELFKELYSLFDDIAGVNFLESTLLRCQEEEVTATKGKVELTTCVKGLSDKYYHLDAEIKELEARIQKLKQEKEQVVQEAETLEPKLREADWTLRSASSRVKEATEERDRAQDAKVLALSRLEEFGRRL